MKANKVPMAVLVARDVMDMQEEIDRLRKEVKCLRDYQRKYNDLIKESNAHSQHMLLGMLELAMKPGVMEAIASPNTEVTGSAERIAARCGESSPSVELNRIFGEE